MTIYRFLELLQNPDHVCTNNFIADDFDFMNSSTSYVLARDPS